VRLVDLYATGGVRIGRSAAEVLDEPGDVHSAEPLQGSGRA
jgi:hypothetical protein